MFHVRAPPYTSTGDRCPPIYGGGSTYSDTLLPSTGERLSSSTGEGYHFSCKRAPISFYGGGDELIYEIVWFLNTIYIYIS